MLSEGRTLYSVLGVEHDAPLKVIKAAYRALAKQYHPDGLGAGKPDAIAKFIEIQEAYNVLSEETIRASYDRSIAGTDDEELLAERPEEMRIDPDEAWHLIAEEHPEINDIHAEFARYSSALANRFRLSVIEREYAREPAALAAEIEFTFFCKYFGDNPAVHELARRLLLAGRREEAKRLGRLVKSLDGELNAAERLAAVVREYGAFLDSVAAGQSSHKQAKGECRHSLRVIGVRSSGLKWLGAMGLAGSLALFLIAAWNYQKDDDASSAMPPQLSTVPHAAEQNAASVRTKQIYDRIIPVDTPEN